ncbi:MAG: photosystem II S4 domain protein [Limnothrix sp. RL_2_0]|nr:photosystem II S4 domain protein [Limnothrix sp. RL_2_0]
MNLPKDNLLKGADNREELSRILDQADQAFRTWDIVQTDFLSPPVLYEATEVLKRLTEFSFISGGGYPQAERQRLAIARNEIPLEPEHIEVAAIDIVGNFLFDTANHPDFLGSLLGTGLVREKVGDILVLGDRGGQAIVVPELVSFLETALVQVRSVPVKTRPITLEELRVRPPKKKELTTVEASLRLDAIASAGLGMSRSKMADAISKGNVKVNWKTITQTSYNVKDGDLISLRGKGRVEVGEVNITKKERYRVQLTRFV